MKTLYLILDLLTFAFPLALSFDKKVRYFGKWKYAFASISLVAVPYIAWDYIFASQSVWGFNHDYLSGLSLGTLPFEEILFFIVVPFACIFIYECCKFYFRKQSLRWVDHSVHILVLLLIIIALQSTPTGAYTIAATIAAFISLVVLRLSPRIQFTGIAFLLSMIPFLLMNGILTGYFTDEPVVWYAQKEFSGYRLLSIPLEDILYSFSLIILTIILYEQLKSRFFND